MNGERSDRSDRSAPFAGAAGRARRIRPAGGYRKLASFQTATLIYDATYRFCERFLDPRSRLVDQMLMAARSGRQNIAEGSRFAATTSQTELRLVNTARSSLEELLLDFEDFLRHRDLPQWASDSPEAQAVREVPARWRAERGGGDRSDQSDRSDRSDPIPRCPQCGQPMALRTAKTGRHAGRQFWGCTAYPKCTGTAEV